MLDKEVSEKLADCIKTMCNLGFSPTIDEILELVTEYVAKNNVNALLFNDGRPGRDWLKAFMKRTHLSMKKAEMISIARKSATGNPFVIYEFYKMLSSLMKEKGFGPNQIWNCNESRFPSNPQRCKVIGKKGQRSFRVTCGAGRENTTTLSVCSAAGRALDPLVIFTGKNLQSSWRGEKALKDT